MQKSIDDGVFPHTCEEPGCTKQVQFDDEPKCFSHSPDEGSSVRGYSAREKAERNKRRIQVTVDTQGLSDFQFNGLRESLENSTWELARAFTTNCLVQANEVDRG